MFSIYSLFLIPIFFFVIAKLFPKIFLPPAPGISKETLVVHCQRMSQTYGPLSLALIAVVWWFARYWVSPHPLLASPVASLLPLAFPLAAYYAWAILFVAVRRGSDPDGVSGGRAGLGQQTELALRHLQNTTEQLLLFALSLAALSAVLAHEELALLPASVALWLSGRILFLLGYTPENPVGREFGFQLTILTSISCLIFFGYRIIFL